jgi:ADP-ribose pyrophosphatase YjhB (NUDIX family)
MVGRRRRAIQRVSVYGIHVVDDEVLLVRASSLTEVPGRWFLPGGGVEHGEHPTEALVREMSEETGLDAVVGRHLGIVSDVRTRRNGVVVHTVRIIHEIASAEGRLLAETSGSSDLARFVPLPEARTIPLADYVIEGAAMAGYDLASR